jgi:hypothetical protein
MSRNHRPSTTSRTERTIMTKNSGPTNAQEKELPRPNVEWVCSGTPQAAMTEAGIKGILVNPLNAGAGPFPQLVSDAHWVDACKQLLQHETPEQFLVNLLFVLRQSMEILGD